MISLTVSELNHYLKAVCDSDDTLRNVFVTGEISNFTLHQRTGHLYFSLKDGDCSIRCVMFARQAAMLRFSLCDGIRVVCGGRVTVYERDGNCQLYAERIIPEGEGAAKAALEKLYAKLDAEGLFAPERKRPLPQFPSKTAVITSASGAALIDITAVWNRTWKLSELLLYSATVQGERAVGEICARLAQITPDDADVVILARGGGSAEDLWVFNNEAIVRAVCACRVPVVSAVGHEVDYTLCDLAADARAATPTAAANLVFPEYRAVCATFDVLLNRLGDSLSQLLQGESRRVDSVIARLQYHSPENMLQLKKQTLQSLSSALRQNIDAVLNRKKNRFIQAVTGLEALSPVSVLLRGYTYVTDGATLVTSAKLAAEKNTLTIHFHDGAIAVQREANTIPEA